MDISKTWTIEENSPDRASYLYDLSELDSLNVSLRIIYDKENDSVKILYREPSYHEAVSVNDKISATHLNMESQTDDETLTHDTGAPKFDQYREILKKFIEGKDNRLVRKKLELLLNDNTWQ